MQTKGFMYVFVMILFLSAKRENRYHMRSGMDTSLLYSITPHSPAVKRKKEKKAFDVFFSLTVPHYNF